MRLRLHCSKEAGLLYTEAQRAAGCGLHNSLKYGGQLGPFPLRISLIEISPVQISRFSCANLTFLLYKSHISPKQISLFSSTLLQFKYLQYKSHFSPVQISPIQISLFSSAKSPHLSNPHAHELHFVSTC